MFLLFIEDERRRREEAQRFESRLDECTNEYDRLQHDYRILAEEIQHKRRTLQDLENELRNKNRKHSEQHANLEHDTDLLRTEYYGLKDELDKLAYTLRFSIEEELRVYEALLNSFQRKKVEHLVIENSIKYQPPPPISSSSLVTETITKKTIKHQSDETIPIIRVDEVKQI